MDLIGTFSALFLGLSAVSLDFVRSYPMAARRLWKISWSKLQARSASVSLA
jgi:hypothetical protein